MSAIIAFQTTYVVNLTKYFASGVTDKNRNEAKAAKKFTDEYVNAVKVGFNVVVNNKLHASITLPNGAKAKLYESIIRQAFNDARKATKESVANQIISNGFANAALSFWTGAMLEGLYKGMPPGHINLIPPIMVTSPGVVPPIKIPPVKSASPSTLPMILSKAYVAHLSTIQFLVPAMVLPFPGTPYPLPLIGLQ